MIWVFTVYFKHRSVGKREKETRLYVFSIGLVHVPVILLIFSLDISSYYGGIWLCISQMMGDDTDSKSEDEVDHEDSNEEASFFLLCSKEDIEDFIFDKAVLEEFPLPQLLGNHLLYLNDTTWEEHVKTLAGNNIPKEIPDTWQDYVAESDENQEDTEDSDSDQVLRHKRADFPLSLYVFSPYCFQIVS